MPLVAGEQPSPLERMLVMADAASGISHVVDWKTWVFINVELGIHLERQPEGEWMAMDAVTRLGPTGPVCARACSPMSAGASGCRLRPSG